MDLWSIIELQECFIIPLDDDQLCPYQAKMGGIQTTKGLMGGGAGAPVPSLPRGKRRFASHFLPPSVSFPLSSLLHFLPPFSLLPFSSFFLSSSSFSPSSRPHSLALSKSCPSHKIYSGDLLVQKNFVEVVICNIKMVAHSVWFIYYLRWRMIFPIKWIHIHGVLYTD